MPTLRIAEVFESEEHSILAIERIDVLTTRHAVGAAASASIRPIALVVREDRHVRACDLNGNPIDLDALCDSYPGVDLELAARVAAHER